jgi:hypothetical protein
MNNQSQYGLQPDQRDEMKAKLRQIVDGHEQRREEVEAATADQIIARRRQWQEEPLQPREEPFREPHEHEWPIEIDGAVVFVTSPETQLDRFIAVHTPELQDLMSAGHLYEVLTGRTVISWRVRNPEDGNAPWVRGVARPKHAAPAPMNPGALRDDLKGPISAEEQAERDRGAWLGRFLRGERNSLEQARISMGVPGQTKPPSTGRSYETITERSRRFANWSRDRR